jgi:hypothetical protein
MKSDLDRLMAQRDCRRWWRWEMNPTARRVITSPMERR